MSVGMPGRYDIETLQGDTYSLEITLKDGDVNGPVVDISAFKPQATVRRYTGGETLVTVDSTNGIDITNLATGQIHMTFNSETTRKFFADNVWDLQLVDDADPQNLIVHTILKGSVRCPREVTR